VWKDFDKRYYRFASDSRNVRLGLASDGFNPFGNMSTTYSIWPVILAVYNLPPWKCMKSPNLLLSLLISGPTSPGNKIDVYLQPLVDDLKELWNERDISIMYGITMDYKRFYHVCKLIWVVYQGKACVFNL